MIFQTKIVFSEETAKNCFGDAFDHFFGGGEGPSYAKN